MASVPFSEEDLHDLYTWVDEIPISRPKRNIARDFADGCSVAEILKFFFPKLVDPHNYVPAMSHAKKLDNWHTLNAKVLRKLYFEVPEEEIEDIVSAVPGAIERFLRALRMKVAQIKQRREEMRATGELKAYEQAHFIEAPTSRDGSARGSREASATGAAAGDSLTNTNGNRNGGSGRRSDSPGSRGPSQANSARVSHAPSNPSPRVEAAGQQPLPYVGAEALEQLHQTVVEKDYTIRELRETVAILSEKIVKLEELVRVKDEKLNQYRQKFGRMPAQ